MSLFMGIIYDPDNGEILQTFKTFIDQSQKEAFGNSQVTGTDNGWLEVSNADDLDYNNDTDIVDITSSPPKLTTKNGGE